MPTPVPILAPLLRPEEGAGVACAGAEATVDEATDGKVVDAVVDASAPEAPVDEAVVYGTVVIALPTESWNTF